ncbi:MAG: IS481 family transposase [Clostridia bacterium]|nr:IS481 family transposase [Clostridia bacterium]
MPWKDKTVEELRKEFVEAAKSCENLSALCREFGITRATGYKWINRYENREGFTDRSRRPNITANKTAEETELRIVQTRSIHPGWGAKKIKTVLENKGVEMPCVKTVNNILNRYGCISKEESLKHKPFTRFEKEQCNEMWQTDFKGEFRMQDGKYCFPLDIFDDHSRYVIKIKPSTSTSNLVLPTFKEAFCEFGMPNSVLSDNGAQFAGFRQGYTQFEKWLMKHDVLPIHGRIKHPQTQGKIERFHRAMNQELLKYYTPIDINDAERVLNHWRNSYNDERPHEALGMRCPSEIYTPSNRTYCDQVKKYEYGGEYHVIKVNSWGYVRFDRFQIYLSETMIDELIEFRPNPNGDTFVACYRNFAIGEFDVHTGKLLHRKIRRL